MLARLRRLPGQVLRRNPFGGTLKVEPLSLLRLSWVTARNFRTPLEILNFVFEDDLDLRYADVPCFPPFLFVRDQELTREITSQTAMKGDFDRDTLPTQGIGRVVGKENLLYSQGEIWRKHKGAVAKPFGTQAVQIPEVFDDLAAEMVAAVKPEIAEIERLVATSPTGTHRMLIEPEIKAVMLTVLVNVLFGAKVDHDELRDEYLPAIESVIRYILWDTIANQLRLPTLKLPSIGKRHAALKRDFAKFEELVDRVLETRTRGAGFWPLLTAAGTDTAIRSNVRVFLAGALEATTSYLCWTLGNLARNPAVQERVRQEALQQDVLDPAAHQNSVELRRTMAESLRLNNALYFLPRVVVRDTTVTTSKGTLTIPKDTHVALATYHLNRSERHWGVEATGFPATEFAPDRWLPESMAAHGRTTKNSETFGFGYGPRVCVGRHFSEAEAFVCLNLILRRFEFTAVHATTSADSGISTRPADGVELNLRLRFTGENPRVSRLAAGH